MDRNDATSMTNRWDQAAKTEAAGFDLPWESVVEALGMVPESGTWTISADRRKLFALPPGDFLFTVTIGTEGRVGVTRRPLNPEKIVVGITWGESRTTETNAIVRPTNWTFRYQDEQEPKEGWQSIVGSVTLDGRGEHLDRPEAFARAISDRAGWPFTTQ